MPETGKREEVVVECCVLLLREALHLVERGSVSNKAAAA